MAIILVACRPYVVNGHPGFGASHSLSQQRFQVPCRDSRCSVATGVGIRQDIYVAIGHGMSRQCLCAGTSFPVCMTQASVHDQAILERTRPVVA